MMEQLIAEPLHGMEHQAIYANRLVNEPGATPVAKLNGLYSTSLAYIIRRKGVVDEIHFLAMIFLG